MSKKFVSVAVDSEDQIVLNKENYDLFATFNDRLREKIIETAAILLQENLFDYTFRKKSLNRHYLSFDFWRSASYFQIDFFTKEKIYLTLTKWGSYGGEDDVTSCTFDSSLLFSNQKDDIWDAAVKRRDKNLAHYDKEIEDELKSKKDNELEEKRKLLEKLKKELGE